MREAGLKEVEEYITGSQNTAAQYFVVQPIMDLWEEAVQRLGMRVSKRWWEQ